MGESSHEEYWKQYSNLQHVKHAIIENYLSGWFPKLSLGPWGASRVVYIDTHAGRGRHLQGQLGSPLVALTTFLNHGFRDRILESSEVLFYFIERDDKNVRALRKELKEVELPDKVFVHAETGDCFKIIDGIITSLDEKGTHLAPSFVFVDPFGFKLPGELLRRLMENPSTELFVNVIWRELDMEISQGRAKPDSGMASTLTTIFDGDGWKGIDADDHNERAEQCASLFREITSAQWETSIWMKDKNRIRYFLLHLTNHDAGRDLMKECIWKACPDGGYYASKSNNPSQQLLIKPAPDLEPLRDWVLERLSDGSEYWQDFLEEIRPELWLKKHLNSVVRKLRRDGEITDDDYTGMFAPMNNPRLWLSKKE